MRRMGKHIYCIIRGEPGKEFKVEGVDDTSSDIYTITSNGISAVVGEAMRQNPTSMSKKKLSNKGRADLMILLLLGILSIELVQSLRVSRYVYREVRGIYMGIEFKEWVWE